MTQSLPIIIDSNTDWSAIRLTMCYRPFPPQPTREELIDPDGYKIDGWVNMTDLTKDIGLVYNDEIKRRRK